LLYLNKYDVILDITKNWENDLNWSAIHGTYRASAYKRQSEELKNKIPQREELISKSIKVFEKIFKEGDYPIFTCIEAKKILNEFDFIVTNDYYSKKIKGTYVSFISKHFFNIISRIRGESIDSKESKDLLSKVYNAEIDINPLHSVSWYSENSTSIYDKAHIAELEEEGYTIVEVYNIPEKNNGLSNFIFAKDKKERQFFLVVAYFESGWNGWGGIEIGTSLAIKYDYILPSDK